MKEKQSIVHDWVSELPLMQQALLLTGVRGPDGCPKNNPAKDMVRFYRGVILKPAGEIEGNEDSFMWIDYRNFLQYFKLFIADTDAYPMHFLMHLIHCAEVIAYKHPDQMIKEKWYYFYGKCCEAFHMNLETVEQMDKRMNL